ncbi:MAG: hypothetical protein IPL40_05265 [Proteobacteria bacterium]|nr:hypothetical protein [Pseudomonadota bacterium]
MALALVLALPCALFARPSRCCAADTIETFAAGGYDLELYGGMFGLASASEGRGRPKPHGRSELILGYGLVDWLALCVGTTLHGRDDAYPDGDAAGYLLLVATPLDTDHLDLDLQLAVALAGPGLRELRYRPELELNVDLRPGLSLGGLYLRLGVPVDGIRPSASGAASAANTTVDLATILGLYLTVASRHQLLLEYDATYHFRPESGAPPAEVGGVALGYNVVLNGKLELIHQVTLDLGQGGRLSAVGASVGFIVTL